MAGHMQIAEVAGILPERRLARRRPSQRTRPGHHAHNRFRFGLGKRQIVARIVQIGIAERENVSGLVARTGFKEGKNARGRHQPQTITLDEKDRKSVV